MENMDLSNVLETLVVEYGLLLVDLTVKKLGETYIIRILVDRPGRVSIDECAELSKKVKDTIENDMLLSGENYRLEVSSPGIGRFLQTEVDWKRTVGRKLSIELEDDSFIDWLEKYDKGYLRFRSGREVPVDEIINALEALE